MDSQLHIVPLSKSHLSKRVQWMQKKEIYLKMPVPYPTSIEETNNWFLTLSDKKNIRADFTVLNFDRSEILGFLGLVNFNRINSNADFYIFFNPEMTGKGIGTPVMKWLVNYAFSVWNLHKFFCYTISKNESANRLYEKIGFSLEGQLREHLFFHKEYVDRNIYAILRCEWDNVNWKEQIAPMIEYQINLQK